jgi:hypothetical protein
LHYALVQLALGFERPPGKELVLDEGVVLGLARWDREVFPLVLDVPNLLVIRGQLERYQLRLVHGFDESRNLLWRPSTTNFDLYDWHGIGFRCGVDGEGVLERSNAPELSRGAH